MSLPGQTHCKLEQLPAGWKHSKGVTKPWSKFRKILKITWRQSEWLSQDSTFCQTMNFWRFWLRPETFKQFSPTCKSVLVRSVPSCCFDSQYSGLAESKGNILNLTRYAITLSGSFLLFSLKMASEDSTLERILRV